MDDWNETTEFWDWVQDRISDSTVCSMCNREYSDGDLRECLMNPGNAVCGVCCRWVCLEYIDCCYEDAIVRTEERQRMEADND